MNRSIDNHLNKSSDNFTLIRMLSSFIVLYSHSYALAYVENYELSLLNTYGKFYSSIAVDIFFTLSGFFIIRSLFIRNNIFNFFKARALRLYPALIVSVLFCAFVIGPIFTTKNLLDYFTDLQTYKFTLKNSLILFNFEYALPGVFENLNYKNVVNGSLWSLFHEIRLYVLIAILYFSIRSLEKFFKKDFRWIYLVLVIISYVIHIGNVLHWFSINISFFHRIFLFKVGVCFYVYRHYIPLKKWLFILFSIAFSISFLTKTSFQLVYYLTLPYMLFYIALVPKIPFQKKWNKLTYSYGIYIYAFPIQQSIASLIHNVSVWEMVLISYPITFILAALSYHFIEKPILKFK